MEASSVVAKPPEESKDPAKPVEKAEVSVPKEEQTQIVLNKAGDDVEMKDASAQILPDKSDEPGQQLDNAKVSGNMGS